jgi:hypothetical protein
MRTSPEPSSPKALPAWWCPVYTVCMYIYIYYVYIYNLYATNPRWPSNTLFNTCWVIHTLWVPFLCFHQSQGRCNMDELYEPAQEPDLSGDLKWPITLSTIPPLGRVLIKWKKYDLIIESNHICIKFYTPIYISVAKSGLWQLFARSAPGINTYTGWWF